MGFSDDYYDILCGNDRRLIKIAVTNDSFHTITIEADVARTIDFSGGTRKIETIRLSRCFKASRLIWPERTGAIRRLFIHNADTLAYLDISELQSLEELSIINCRSLEDIRGIPASLKEINAHNCKLETLDLSNARNLQRINIVTTSPTMNIDASKLDNLLAVYVKTKNQNINDDIISNFNFSNCTSLYNLYINCENNSALINIEACGILTNIFILSGEESRISGLSSCKEIEVFYADNLKIEEPDKFIVNKSARNKKLNQEKLESAVEFSKAFQEFVLNQKPGQQDRETIIQQSGAKRELEQGRDVKISMLSVPQDLLRLVSEQDLQQIRRSIEFDSTGVFRNEPNALVLHLQQHSHLKNIESIYPQAAHFKLTSAESPDDTIKNWLKNKNKLTPNILMLSENELRNPNVYKLLRHLKYKGQYWLYKGHRYRRHLYDRIFYFGNPYLLRNMLPAFASDMLSIPASYLLHPVAASEAQTLSVANRHAEQQIAKELFNRQTQIISLYNEFSNYLIAMDEERRYQSQLALMQEPLSPQSGTVKSGINIPDQTPIDNSSNATHKPLDDTPQTGISGHASDRDTPYDDQINIDGEKDRKLPDYDDQHIIAAGSADPDNLRGRHAPQTPIDSSSKNKAMPEPEPQINIDADAASHPDDMDGKLTPQHNINAKSSAKPRPDIDDQTPIDVQSNHSSKKLPDIDDQTPIDAQSNHSSKKLPDIDDQMPIDAQSNHSSRALPEFDEQTNIDANSSSNPELRESDKMNPAATNQIPLKADKHAKNLQTEPVNDQHFLSADQSSQEPLKSDQLNPESTNDQEYIDAKKKSIILPRLEPEITPAQTFFHASRKRHEINIPEQINIDAEASAKHDSGYLRILETSRKLADAMMQMAETIKKPNQSQQIVTEVIIKLKKDLAKPLDKQSFYDAAVSLTQAMRALHDTCANTQAATPSLANHKNRKSLKQTEQQQQLLRQLKNIHQQYVHDHGLQTRTEGMFGYKAGIISARSELLKSLVDAIEQNKEPDIKLSLIFDELKKDPAIRIAICSLEDDVAATLKTSPKKQLTDK